MAGKNRTNEPAVAAFRVYQKRLDAAQLRGIGGEHTHRPALKALLESLDPRVVAINEPGRIECGAPDFLVERKKNIQIGFIETKDTHVDLEKEERGEQLTRYRSALHNLILTNYRDFRWYMDGELKLQASLTKDDFGQVDALIRTFLTTKTPSSGTPEDLASRLAHLAKMLRAALLSIMASDSDGEAFRDQLKGFRKVLIEDMTEEQFADMYAQTIAYGLFAARCNVDDGGRFDRKTGIFDLPSTNPFMRQVLGHVAGPDLDIRVTWIVDCIADLLACADMHSILEAFGKAKANDPVIHFYETFLAKYDSRLRKVRGVYYTPKPVVDFIVRSVDRLLEHEFNLDDGLANTQKIRVQVEPTGRAGKRAYRSEEDVPKVLVLDPAAGTGAFLQGVAEVVHDRVTSGGQGGMWNGYVKEHLLPRLYGFELLIAPYAIAHLKLGLQLERTGYQFTADERLRVYLTNALEEAWEVAGLPLFGQMLVEEARAAGKVKQDLPIMVIIGNPPYAGHSANKGKWIDTLTDDYRKGIPGLARPGQAKWLKDDYVKFIRFAQWRIEKTGYGVLAFITNHAWLNNPTFRGMRKSLMDTFDSIWVLDLHGSAKRASKGRNNEKDENVFDIQQGVAISFFVKKVRSKRSSQPATVKHAELRGARDSKYEFLASHTLKTVKWKTLEAADPDFSFVPIAARAMQDEYSELVSVPTIFSVTGSAAPGIVTTHDQFAISWTQEEMIDKVESLLRTTSEAEAREQWKLCSQSQWDYERARKELATGAWKKEVGVIEYRPFDSRYTVYNRNVAVHMRMRVNKHMIRRENFGLVLTRQQATEGSWSHCFVVCNAAIESAMISNKTKEINYLFPLWVYADDGDLLQEEHSANINAAFLKRLPLPAEPTDALAYIYAILWAPSYRTRYAELLRNDFPRVPVTTQSELFASLVTLGHELVGLHTMQTKVPNRAHVKFPIAGSNRVESRPRWEDQRVWINATQYFQDVPLSAWEFKVGAYAPAEKWLVDRQRAGRSMSFDDIEHYQKIINVLVESIRVMTAIDHEIVKCGGWPLK